MRSEALRFPTVIAMALLAPIALVSAAFAQGVINVPEHPARPVVIELFSSQGCGNCPQANQNVAGLAQRSDVIAMTYPVGIWDYLGWSDTLAKPEFSERQKQYNQSMGYRGPYTPQIVYGGRLHSSGVNLKAIEDGFAKRDITPYAIKVSIDGDKATISGAFDGKAIVNLVQFRPGMTKVTPGGGANQGKAMSYFNLVTGVSTLGQWAGGTASYPIKCDKGCTVLVQKESPTGNIVGVAQKK